MHSCQMDCMVCLKLTSLLDLHQIESSKEMVKNYTTCLLTVYMQGFIQRGGGRGLEFPPPEILELSMVIIVLSQVLNNNLVTDCVRNNLRGSKFLGEHAPRPP